MGVEVYERHDRRYGWGGAASSRATRLPPNSDLGQGVGEGSYRLPG
jgi:hypothetical protein